MELGARLKEYRNNSGMTQDALAERLYVTRQTISSWENDKSYPDIHSLLMLSEVFNVSLDTLVKGDIEIMKEKVSPLQYISVLLTVAGSILVVADTLAL